MTCPPSHLPRGAPELTWYELKDLNGEFVFFKAWCKLLRVMALMAVTWNMDENCSYIWPSSSVMWIEASWFNQAVRCVLVSLVCAALGNTIPTLLYFPMKQIKGAPCTVHNGPPGSIGSGRAPLGECKRMISSCSTCTAHEGQRGSCYCCLITTVNMFHWQHLITARQMKLCCSSSFHSSLFSVTTSTCLQSF